MSSIHLELFFFIKKEKRNEFFFSNWVVRLGQLLSNIRTSSASTGEKKRRIQKHGVVNLFVFPFVMWDEAHQTVLVLRNIRERFVH